MKIFRRGMFGGAVLTAFSFAMIKRVQNQLRNQNMVLWLDLRDPVVETPLSNIQEYQMTGSIVQSQNNLKDVLDTLKLASTDSRVKGVVANVENPGPLGTSQELVDAILRFRQESNNEKFTIALGGDMSQNGYYVASCFSKVYLQPAGMINLVGVSSYQPFIAGLLQKLKVTPHVIKSSAHKTFGNIFTEKGLTPEHRETTQRVVDSIYNQTASGIAKNRGFTLRQVDELIDEGPLTSLVALSRDLVDGTRYGDEVADEVKEVVGKTTTPLRTVSPSEYLKITGAYLKELRGSQDHVALIHGAGEVLRRGEGLFSSRGLTQAFTAAIKDEKVKVIVFRIDSPGGDFAASDTIWRLVATAQKKGKKVVASFGNTAASGGYYAAVGADRIIANPGCITGSIGVIMVGFQINGFLDELGVTVDSVQRGKYAGLATPFSSYSAEELEKLHDLNLFAYNTFVDRVTKGRNMTTKEVEKLATGTVWTGDTAMELGLVDELGGLYRAFEVARELAEIPADAPVKRFYPAPKWWLKPLVSLLADE